LNIAISYSVDDIIIVDKICKELSGVELSLKLKTYPVPGDET
jgi:hypothetical protein